MSETTNPQGVVFRYMATRVPRRDLIQWGSAAGQTVPRLDPAGFPTPVYLALPILDDRGFSSGRVRIRDFTAEMAADRLSREAIPGRTTGIRLASEEEIAEYHQEAAERAVKAKAERVRREAAELEYEMAKKAGVANTANALRAIQWGQKI